MHLLVAILLCSLSLIEPLQHAVVLLIEAPGLADGDPVEIHLIEDDIEGLDGTLEVAGVGEGEVKSILLQRLACSGSLLDTLIGQVHIGPSGKAILQVPLTLSVAYQY